MLMNTKKNSMKRVTKVYKNIITIGRYKSGEIEIDAEERVHNYIDTLVSEIDSLGEYIQKLRKIVKYEKIEGYDNILLPINDRG